MITTGSKLYFGAAAAALISAALYGWGTGGGLLGVLTGGLMGGAGDLAGLTVLLFLATAALTLGVATSAFRDADADAAAAVARLDAVPETTPAQGPSFWPVVGAFAATVTMIGLVISPVLFVAGLLLVGVAVIEWTISAWSERATGDPEVNRQIRNRLLYPFEVPIAGVAGIVLVVASLSRVLLALSKTGSAAVAIVIAVLILVGGFLVAYRPKISRDAVAAVLTIGAVAIVAAGIAAAAAGPRDFEQHGGEGGGAHEPGTENGLGPVLIIEAATTGFAS